MPETWIQIMHSRKSFPLHKTAVFPGEINHSVMGRENSTKCRQTYPMGCPKIPFAVPLPHEGPAVARERPPVLNHKVDNPRYNVWARHGRGTERKNGVAGGLRLASAGLLDICIEIACSLSYTADTFFF